MNDSIKLEVGKMKLEHCYIDDGEKLIIEQNDNVITLVNEEITWLRRLLEMV